MYELKVDDFFFNPNSNNKMFHSNNKMFRKFDKHDILKNKVDNASSNKNHLIISSHLIYIIISEYKR